MATALEKLKKDLKKQDPGIKFSEPEGKATLVLISAAKYGSNKERIRKFTGISGDLVEKYLSNLETGGVIKKGKVYHSGWFNKKTGGAAFQLDVCVALGLVTRSNDEKDKK